MAEVRRAGVRLETSVWALGLGRGSRTLDGSRLHPGANPIKSRVRFGFKLSWPITNAAIFVFYVKPKQAEDLKAAVEGLRLLLQTTGQAEIASRLVCEVSS